MHHRGQMWGRGGAMAPLGTDMGQGWGDGLPGDRHGEGGEAMASLGTDAGRGRGQAPPRDRRGEG